MKKIVIIFMVGLLTQQVTHAQGTLTYLSNLGSSGIGIGVGSNLWETTSFFTGTNASGYVLNSIQLEMAGAAGNPSGFMVMVYSAIFNTAESPGSSLGTLDGSANPLTNGTYIYTPASNLTLSPDTTYFIVLTAETPFASPAGPNPIGYYWERALNPTLGYYNPSGGWIGIGDNYYSSDGSSWNFISTIYPEYAITATPVPEPSSEILLGLGGLFFLLHRWKAKVA